ncbi:hypothetical protein Hanom_Chr01g00070061 [Helianthus anomalus]
MYFTKATLELFSCLFQSVLYQITTTLNNNETKNRGTTHVMREIITMKKGLLPTKIFHFPHLSPTDTRGCISVWPHPTKFNLPTFSLKLQIKINKYTSYLLNRKG